MSVSGLPNLTFARLLCAQDAQSLALFEGDDRGFASVDSAADSCGWAREKRRADGAVKRTEELCKLRRCTRCALCLIPHPVRNACLPTRECAAAARAVGEPRLPCVVLSHSPASAAGARVCQHRRRLPLLDRLKLPLNTPNTYALQPLYSPRQETTTGEEVLLPTSAGAPTARPSSRRHASPGRALPRIGKEKTLLRQFVFMSCGRQERVLALPKGPRSLCRVAAAVATAAA